jgi:prophage regulatory protein
MDTITAHPSGLGVVRRLLLRLPEVQSMVGLSRATIYRLVGKGEFPYPVKLTRSAVAWKADDVLAWVNSRMPVNDGAASAAA